MIAIAGADFPDAKGAPPGYDAFEATLAGRPKVAGANNGGRWSREGCELSRDEARKCPRECGRDVVVSGLAGRGVEEGGSPEPRPDCESDSLTGESFGTSRGAVTPALGGAGGWCTACGDLAKGGVGASGDKCSGPAAAEAWVLLTGDVILCGCKSK